MAGFYLRYTVVNNILRWQWI